MRDRPARPLAPLPWWIAAWTSVGFHAVVLGVVGFVGGAGHPDAGGDGGVAGAGGDTFEVTVIASRASSGDSTENDAAAVREADSETEAEAEAERPVLAARERDPGRDRIRVREAAPEPASPEPHEHEPEPQDAPVATVATGGDSDATRTGRAAGDPEAAAVILGSVGLGRPGGGPRAILERTLACDDPIEGVWVAHRYRPGARAWARFTLRIDREGDALHGTILSRTWSGYATDRRPPPCTPDGYDQTYRMVASGTIRGDEFSFGATTHQLVRTDCPSLMITSYAPDRFRGTVDPVREELDTLNNDGRYDLDAPYTFRRTACLDDE